MQKRKKLKFENLMGSAAEISPVNVKPDEREGTWDCSGIEAKVTMRSKIFLQIYRLWVLVHPSANEKSVLKDFIDQIVYGLSDSAKAIYYYFVYWYVCDSTHRMAGKSF